MFLWTYVYYEHVFVYCDAFVITIFFFDLFTQSILNRFHILIYFYLFSVLYWDQKKPQEVFFKQRCSLKLRDIYACFTPVLRSLSNKVVGSQACKYIKKRLQHWCFLWNLQKILRTSFLKNICERLPKSVARIGWRKENNWKVFSIIIPKGSGRGQKQPPEVFYEKSFS